MTSNCATQARRRPHGDLPRYLLAAPTVLWEKELPGSAAGGLRTIQNTQRLALPAIRSTAATAQPASNAARASSTRGRGAASSPFDALRRALVGHHSFPTCCRLPAGAASERNVNETNTAKRRELLRRIAASQKKSAKPPRNQIGEPPQIGESPQTNRQSAAKSGESSRNTPANRCESKRNRQNRREIKSANRRKSASPRNRQSAAKSGEPSRKRRAPPLPPLSFRARRARA